MKSKSQPAVETISVGAATLYCQSFLPTFKRADLLFAIRDKRLKWVRVKSGLQLDWAEVERFAASLE